MGRRLAGLGVVLLAVAALSTSAGADQGTGGWNLRVSGKMFSGTFTNPTASVINDVAVGTPQKAKNPIVSMTFAGQTCGLYAPYGSAFCGKHVSIKPGKSASFSGDAKKPIGSGGLQMCSSADGGMDNTCVDVVSASSKSVVTTPTTTVNHVQLHAQLARAYVLKALSAEATALEELNKGDTHAAAHQLLEGRRALTDALSYDIPADIRGDLRSASSDDYAGAGDLYGTKPGKIQRTRALIKDAQGKKTTAALDLNHIAHS